MSNTKKKKKLKFYNINPVLSKGCLYNMIIGERSNGKTYSVLRIILENWVKKGKQGAYIRRWKEDYRGKRGTELFKNHIENGVIAELTDGEYDRVRYYSGKWYLAKYDEELDKLITQEEPFCYGFALSDMEHDKSGAYPNITTVCFDEFLTRGYYLPDEFVTFANVLSTIIRHRDDVIIYMLANTVNKYCPYFKEMGLRHVADMELGTIDVYTYGESGLSVAVERCEPTSKEGKPSDKYFAFDNPSLSMITGGAWEIAMYPHSPCRFEPSEIMFTFFIDFNENLLQGEIVCKRDCVFLYMHEKSTPIKYPNRDIIFTEEYDPRPNYFRNLLKGDSKIEKQIRHFFKQEKVFYQNNEVGEIVRNYLMRCKSER